MSTVFSKNKEKRSRSSSNETNNSFVRNVTSRVSGLLPATITKWFSSPSSSNANGSTAAADATDSSTEDEAPESPITTEPPPKRMKFSTAGNYNNFGSSDPNCIPAGIDTVDHPPYSTVQSAPTRSTFRKEANYVSSTPIRAPNEESVIERNERESTLLNKSRTSVISAGPSVGLGNKRKSLFNANNKEASMRALETTANNTRVDTKAPCFKPALLGSPFYPGQTMYGGASTSVYINQPNIKHKKVALVNESSSSDNTAISHSARRILDLLENYSSPLMEARRLSQIVNNSSSKNDTSNSSTISGSPYSNKVISYKTQELHAPNIATILRLKQRSRLMDTTNAARQIIASHSSTSDYIGQPYASVITHKERAVTEPSKMTTKVKNRLTRAKRGESDMEEQTITPVSLPTGVLQIDKDNLPKFHFDIPVPKPAPTSMPTPKFTIVGTANKTDKTPAAANSDEMDSSKPNVSNNNVYKFSSPVRISRATTIISSTPPKFKFGSPERGVDKPKSDNDKKDHNPSYVIGLPKVTEKLPIRKSADWKCPDCWVCNKPEVNNCVCCGTKQPPKEATKPKETEKPNETAQPLKCAICKLADRQFNSEKCVNCDKIKFSNSIKMNFPTAASSNWNCADCWVSNDEKADKCVCCGGKNPKKSSGPSVASGNGDSEWKCEDCWIKNKSGDEKCAACGGARPGAKPKTAPEPLTNNFGSTLFRTDNSLKNIAKTQSDKWECPSCLVRNDNSTSKCVCCDESKPGTVKVLDNHKAFNFGSVTATSFKFGIDPKAQDTKASSTKLPEIKFGDGLAKPEESETNNNVYKSSANRFTFGTFAKKPEEQTEVAKENKANEAPKLGLTFAMPKTQTLKDPDVIPVFGSPKKLVESVQEKVNDEKEKPQEVPSLPKVDFKFTPPKNKSPKKITGLFAPALSSTPVNLDNTSPATTLNTLGSNAISENKPNTVNSLSPIPGASTPDAVAPFKFTDIGLKPPQNMFAAPTSTPPSFSSTIQSKPTTSAMPVFQKLEQNAAPPMFMNPNATTSTVSMFQKTETITTAAPQSLAATGPVFSFGSNAAPSAALQSDKPKFNFTFSMNPPQFNSNAFSAAPQNSNTNKFSITGGALGGNGLPATNPLTTGNTPTAGKVGSVTELATNPLSSRSELPAPGNLFGVPVQKENLWSANNNSSTNMFVSNASTNSLQKPPAFSFGSSTPFNSSNQVVTFGGTAAPTQNNQVTAFGSNTAPSQNNQVPAFGSTAASQNNQVTAFGSNTAPSQNNPVPTFGSNTNATASQNNPLSGFGSTAAPAQNNPVAPFGSTAAAQNNGPPAFGSSAAPAQNMFGMNQNTSAQPSMFSNPVRSPPAQTMFGAQQPANNAAPSMNLFGSPGVGAAPAFGTTNPPIVPLNPAPAPAFNFGAPQPSTGVFGFGQTAQQAQPAGVYSFGAPGGAPQVQFAMGRAPSAAGARRMRKAFRRNSPR
ncbi:nuclear pore complex protein Nup153 isoform X1 [Ostrinia furnacalis]|uniref:nuclear pore complex protein Nup153 isoform X1 n=1 Tax=Ostrinia furnacalis TaxID=93504 RepID=UPI001040A401|nr:nuclear pore complex protein Nup153 isoform X1 [Ostrinia furnacalis]XP_028178376.1 nuclear pore complex protein Nup153 isoform X1 [Ostrinia furnacalis]